MTKQAIVIVTMTTGEFCYFGPFANGTEATYWAADNCKGFEWHWEEICPVNLPDED